MFIAVDIGGTKTEIGMYEKNFSGSFLFQKTIPTAQSYDKAILEMISIIQSIITDKNIEGITISFAGEVNLEGELIHAVNLPDFVGKPLKKDLEKKFNTSVSIIHDSVASAIAEFNCGSIKNHKRILVLIMGTGIGGAYGEISENKTTITACEPGGLIVEVANGRAHPFNKTKGLLESYVGGASVEAFHKVHLGALNNTDPLWEEITDYLAIGINNFNCMLRLDAVVIGGHIGLARSKALEKIREKAAQYNEFRKLPEILFTRVDGNPSLIGVALLRSVGGIVINN